VCARADGYGSVVELNEGNNGGSSSGVTVVAPLPDLVAVSLDGPSAGTQGGIATLTIRIMNAGNAASGSCNAGLYLSVDEAITQTDISVGTVSIPGIASGASITGSTNVIIPVSTQLGNYYWGLRVDSTGTIPESSEDNNVVWDTTPVQISAQEPGETFERQVEMSIIRYTNLERTNAGLPPLSEDIILSDVARVHSVDMITRNYFDHNTPEGLTPWQRMNNAGYFYICAAENIASNSYRFNLNSNPDDVGRYFVQSQWMQSSGHRANILNTCVTEIGVGVAYSSAGSEFIATQDFAKPR
jgi:uncharacterized protein YkwD